MFDVRELKTTSKSKTMLKKVAIDEKQARNEKIKTLNK